MKIGVLGSGMIANEFLKVVKDVDGIEVKSICGTERSLDKLKEIASEFKIDEVFTNYKEFLESDIDSVYVAVPNNLHYEMAKEAILANKNVLLEKPFTTNYEETVELISLAKDQKVILLEAITTLFLPTYIHIKDNLKNLGDIKIVSMNYSKYSSRYDMFKKDIIAPVFDVNKGGGALMDLNIYNIHFVAGLFGKPDKIDYVYNLEKNVDTSGILILSYPKFKCTLVASKDSNGFNSISIQGDGGFISSTSPSNSLNDVTIQINNEEECNLSLNKERHRMYYELMEFKNICDNKNYNKSNKYNENTIVAMYILEKAQKCLGL